MKHKKILAGRVLGVGANRIVLNPARLEEIKEAITRQDMKDLFADGAIMIKAEKGKQKIVKRRKRRGAGRIKMIVNKRKGDYVRLTRKLRKHLKELLSHENITKEAYFDARKKIKASMYKSKAHLKESLKRGEVNNA